MTFAEVLSLLLRGLWMALQMLLIFAALLLAALLGALVGLVVRLFFLPTALIQFVTKRAR